MDGSTRGRKILLRDLNAHLLCVLCGGYYIDATSISECLHTFCRSCIVKYVEKTRFCPICEVQLNNKNPLLSLSPDKTLQRLVYKMVPGLYSSEMARRRSFYQNGETSAGSSSDETDASSCDVPDSHLIDAAAANVNGAATVFYSPEDSISLSLEYYNSPDKTLQRLVYKMVPGLYSSEMARRRSFYQNGETSAGSSSDETDASSCDVPDSHLIDAAAANVNGAATVFYSPEDSISLSLEYYNSDKEAGDESDVNCCLKKVGPPRRYLKCPAALKMILLKKFLRTKYGLAPDHKVDIIYADADECLSDDISLMDVAYIFLWNRANPMRFSYRILEWSTVKVPASFGNTGSATSPQPALTSDTPPDQTRQPPSSRTSEKESSSRGRRIQDDKRRIRETDSEPEIKMCRQKQPKQEPKKRARREPSIKKSRVSKKNALKKKVNNYLKSTKSTPIQQTPPEVPDESMDSLLTKEPDIKDSIQEKIEACIENIDQDIDNDISMELLEDQIEEEIVDDDGERWRFDEVKQTDSSKEKVEEDKVGEDFALRDKQNENDEEEEDDEFRLRISASEEDCPQEEEPSPPSPTTVDIEPETVSESSRSKDRKESLKRNGEFKVKRKNKKAKHHHHHRHHDRRRDHHPPAATILPSPDTKDLMKLKVKLTTVKPDEQSKHKYNSHSPSRHHNSKHKVSYQVISDDSDHFSNHSNGHTNSDVEKSEKPSQVVENGSKPNDLPNKKPEDRLSPVEKPKASPILINSSTETDKSHTNGDQSNSNKSSTNSNNKPITATLSSKERLLQMRAVRHKPSLENSLQNFRSLSNNNNNNNNNSKNNNNKNDDNDVIEIEEIKTSNSTILIPPSSITVSKITAAEKKKMDEEKLLKMSGKGISEMESKRPALEIMLVEAPPQTKNAPVKHTQDEKKQDDKVNNINASKINSNAIPIVKLQKTLNLQQNGRQSLLTIAQKLNNSKTLNNKSPPVAVNRSLQVTTPNNKETKSKQQQQQQQQQQKKTSDDVKVVQDSNGSSLNKNRSPGSHDTGALDLSDKSSRKGSSPASSISSDGCPSPNSSNFYSLLQSQTNERTTGHQQPQTSRTPANNSSQSPASASPKNGPESGFPAAMRNLMTLSDTASQIRDMMAARDTTDRFQQLARTHNFQQKRSPQHFHSESPPSTIKLPQAMLSPSTRAVLASSPTTPLKIPVPRAVPINNKMIANRNGTTPMPVRPFSPPKKVGVNGRTHVMPPPPAAIPLASIRRMESMTRSLNIEKVAAGLQVKAAVEAGFSVQ
ncbi:LOW QUALITY PROTEIN: uncharacterized protein DDB_G0283697-like [Nilaparvata lugens]|uniref:LOW QUALITY PROTEIN: uncharacterized protein DDB_G0283697-like n=1 Tax=Nilaparvata lugens TaxID=108931 RepID=UPI00193E8F8A|nr:LOW QUALITY PROTEIN: uncharacterized protein DDB_G0283697-like [Nilaparvata lugens]